MRAVVVLGGTGRLGRRVITSLAEDRFSVFVISRSGLGEKPVGVHSLRCDVTRADDRDRCLREIARRTEALESLVVVDALLDKRSVGRMKNSVHGATALATSLADWVASRGAFAGVVACSSTAVLAPRVLSTPYGTFKKEQLMTYASRGHPVSLLLLPSLFDASAEGGHDEQAGASTVLGNWALSFDDAGAVVLRQVRRLGAASRVLAAPGPSGTARLLLSTPPAGQVAAWLLVAPYIVWRLTLGRDSPRAHRRSSRMLLSILSPGMRARVDHHLAPRSRMRSLARQLSCALETY